MFEPLGPPLERGATLNHNSSHTAPAHIAPRAQPEQVDVLLLNPPPSDAAQHAAARVPQTDLAQIGAVLHGAGYRVEIVDAIGLSMKWEAVERRIWALRPRYLIFQAATPTLTNDMRAALIGKAIGSVTLAFGAHVTALSQATLEAYPVLDIVVRGEPELTILDTIQTIDRLSDTRHLTKATPSGAGARVPDVHQMPSQPTMPLAAHNRFSSVSPDIRAQALRAVHGIAFCDQHMQVCITSSRIAIENLDSLPLPLHELLPWRHYRHPLAGAPYACVRTSRGCPASCCFCLKHATERAGVRHRSVDHVLEELLTLKALGIRQIHFDADLFTVKKEFIYDLCGAIVKRNLAIRWSCNSRVDSVDQAELHVMKQAGCVKIGWAIESGSETILQRARKPTSAANIQTIIAASQRAGIKNWGYFQIGLPGETIATIQETIALSKRLPLDRALFRVATPYPGTPFYAEALHNGWLAIERWEDYGSRTVLSYPHLPAQQLEYWARRAAREWALRPSALLTFLRGALSADIGRQHRPAGDAALSWS